MKKLAAISAVLAITASVPALANEGKDKMTNDYFKMMDTNGDGKISEQENKEFSERKFEEADTNHDGSVTLAELKEQKKRDHADWKNASPASGERMKGSSTVNLPNRTNANPTDHSMNPTNPSQSDR